MSAPVSAELPSEGPVIGGFSIPPGVAQGIALQNAGKLAAAEALFREHLAREPHHPVATYSLAVILMGRRDLAEAMTLVHPAAHLSPNFAPLWFVLGMLMQASNLTANALVAFDNALKVNPAYLEVLINSGALLRELHRPLEALERFQKVVAIQPDHQAALSNSAIILSEYRQHEDAIRYFARVVALNPEADYGLGHLVFERLHLCDWSDFSQMQAAIVNGLRAGRKTCKSLGLMGISDDPAAHQQSARLFATRYATASAPLWKGERYRHQRIRVGYVSPDLREHPVGHLMAGVLEQHDHGRFEIYAISSGPDDGSAIRQRISAAVDHFIDVRHLTSQQTAQRLRELEIDIAVDLAGFTADSRPDVYLMRPAPVQVNYLGYPGTCGLPCMDYILADRHVIPLENQRFFDEKVVYLPDCYLPAPAGLTLAADTPSRESQGLPAQGFVFCSFCNDFKISPHIFGAWVRLLQQTPGSVLWLSVKHETARTNLRRQLTDAGLDPARLVFAERVPRVEDHLVRYRLADLFLDTHPYNAHTTAADALSVGCPVLTYSGGAFAARVAGSVLHAAGLPELVTTTLADYEAKALRLAADPSGLALLRERLLQMKHSAVLFDVRNHCLQMEAAFMEMWRETELRLTATEAAP